MSEEKTENDVLTAVREGPAGAAYEEWRTKDNYVIRAVSFPDGSAQSQQIEPDEGSNTVDGMGSDELLDVDYDPLNWARVPEMNTRLRSSIRITATNIGGLQWEIETIKNDSMLDEKLLEIANKQMELVKKVFDRPNPNIPLRSVCYRCWYDRKAVGTGLLEITRGGAGQIDGIYHLQSKYVRRLKRGGWRQTKLNIKKYFKDFGDKTVLSAKTGQPPKADELDDDLATEVISFIEYSSDVEPVVGVPPHAAAVEAISGNYYAAKRNSNMQRVDATPRIIITLEGGELSDESEKSIRDFLNAAARNDQDLRSNRMLVLSVAKSSPSSSEKSGIKIHPLTVASNEDATFQVYRGNNDDEIRESFSLAPLFYGSTDGTNRASASVARHITIEQAFNPETEELEYRMNESLVKDILNEAGYEDDEILVRYHLIRPQASDEIEMSEVISRYAQMGAYSPNDIRRRQRKMGEDVDLWKGAWAEIPLFITLSLIKSGTPPSAMGFEESGLEDMDFEGLTADERMEASIKALGLDEAFAKVKGVKEVGEIEDKDTEEDGDEPSSSV